MPTPLVAALSHGACFGLAFAPPGSLQLGVSRHTPPRLHRRLSTKLLFSPEHGDHAGPIAVVTSKKDGSGKTVGRTTAGGWGSLAKVVSQREEQDGVLQKFSSQGGVDVESGLRVRTAQKNDMFSISHLCVDTFRGPFQWFELPLQLFQDFSFFGQINDRLERVTRNEIRHSMVVVEDKQSGKVVGFLEIGMLPKPTSSEERSLAESTLAETAATAVAASVSAAAATATAQAAGEEGSPASDGERDETSEESGDLDVSHDSVGSTAIERSPDVSYLANVVVDRSQRRRGIGRTMVNSALEIVRELWPEEERIYVSVEQ
ncbi:unnamed protein product, partial [Laminaria digitata]